MIKVLFICHGNICRSPMAEFIMKDLVRRMGLSDQFYIASAATSNEEIWQNRGGVPIGNPVYPPARETLTRHGIGGFEGKRAVQLTKQDYDAYDYLIGMDGQNIRNMERVFGRKGGKIHKLLEFAGSDADVADPWYTRDFDRTYEDVLMGCKGLLDYLRRQGCIEESNG